VERASDDLRTVVTTYKGKHNHDGQNLAADSAREPTVVDQPGQKYMFSGQGSFGLGGARARGSSDPSSFFDNTMGVYMSQQEERHNAAPREDMFSPQSTD
jgi:hypothetical protein